MDVLQRLIALNHASGHVANLTDAARRWAHEEPWNEEAVLAVVQAYVAEGDRDNAQVQLKVAQALLDRTSAPPRLRTTFDQLDRAAARLPSFKPQNSSSGAERNFPTVDFGRYMLLGRQGELGQLKKVWAAACGGSSQVLTLEGDTGIGKSRLVNELVAHVRSGSEHPALVGHGNIRTNDHALGMLRTAFAYIPEAYRVTLQTAAEAISEQAWNAVSLYPEFRALAPDREPGYLAPLDAASEVTRRHVATLELLDAIMVRGCLLLVWEDAYPGDAETRRIIDALTETSRRVLVVRTRRASSGEE
ncbi:MAG: hypothetical protein AVDCRST_MAG93-4153, partial [uncultured Chloroflexia bacterium]